MTYFLSFTKLALWLKVEGRSGRMYASGKSLAKRLPSVTMLLLLKVFIVVKHKTGMCDSTIWRYLTSRASRQHGRSFMYQL